MTVTHKLKHAPVALAILAALVGVAGLLPLAFGMPGIAMPLFPFASTAFLLLMLGGPLLLLASGLQGIARNVPKSRFFVSFIAFMVVMGFALFWKSPSRRFSFDWILMTLVVVLIAAALRHTWVWSVVGGIWTGTLLGLASAQTAVEVLSPAYHGSPGWWWPLWLVGCILAFGSATIAFVRRSQVY